MSRIKLKTIGLIGGMGWQSTVLYYEIINRYIQRELGDLYSAKIILSSVNFSELENYQRNGKWDLASEIILTEALRLQHAGCDSLFICSATGNESVDRIQDKLNIPIIHIADSLGQEIVLKGYKKVGLLATIYTMEEDYLKGKLENKYGIKVIVPNQADRKIVSSIIYNELCQSKINIKSKMSFLTIIGKFKQQNVDAVILGCTEIPLLIESEDTNTPLLDITKLHAEYAAKGSIIYESK